ncbi:MAG: outer membrane beta-barrel protein [Desulfosudaceae bacterium]
MKRLTCFSCAVLVFLSSCLFLTSAALGSDENDPASSRVTTVPESITSSLKAIAINGRPIPPTATPRLEYGDVITFRVRIDNTHSGSLNNLQGGVMWGRGLDYQGNLTGNNVETRYDERARKISVLIDELPPTLDTSEESATSYSFNLKVVACDDLSVTVLTDELYAVRPIDRYDFFVRAPQPEIEYDLTASPEKIKAGQTSPVEIDFVNSGQGTANDLIIKTNLENFPATVSNVSPDFDYDAAAGVFSCGREINPDSSLTLSFDLAIDAAADERLPKRAVVFEPDYADDCGDSFQAAPTPLVLRPPEQEPQGSGANLGLELLLQLPETVQECGEYEARVIIEKTRPEDIYDLEISLGLDDHYAYLGDFEATGFGGVSPRVNVEEPGRVDFSFDNEPGRVEPLSEGGSLSFNLRKTCATPAGMTVTARFIHHLAAAKLAGDEDRDQPVNIRKRDITVHAEPLFNTMAELATRVSPESCRVVPGEPVSWSIQVTNYGSAAATDVICEDILGEWLQWHPPAENAGQADSPEISRDDPVQGKTRLTWQLGDIEPSRSKSVTVRAMPSPDKEIAGVMTDSSRIRVVSGCDEQDCHTDEQRAPRFIYHHPEEEQEGIDGQDVFEGCGRLHGFFSLTEMYKSNLYKNSDDDDEEDVWATYLTPGIWAALPGSCQRLVEVSTTTAAPGGMSVQPYFPGNDRRFQGYLLYSPQFEFYDDHSDDNMVSHRVDGYLQYNTRNKLLLRMIEQYKRSHDALSSRNFSIDDKYHANLFKVMTDVDLTQKLSVGLNYSNYILDYDASGNDHADRVDHAWALSGGFHLTSKVTLFTEYNYANLYYSSNDLDSDEHRFFGGVRWEMTGKSSGRIKGGYGKKVYDSSQLTDVDTWMAEAVLDHDLTAKTSLSLNVSRRYDEALGSKVDADNLTSNMPIHILTNMIGLAVDYDMTSKLHFNGQAMWTFDEYGYEDDLRTLKEREDTEISLSPSLKYEATDWLSFDLAYIYTDRDSNYSGLDYTDNTVFVRANFYR